MGAGAAWSDPSGGSLAVGAPLLAEESLFAGTAFVDGVLAAGAVRCRGWRCRWGLLGPSPVSCLSTGVAAVALVGTPGQRIAADCAAGRCHVAVTVGVFRH